MTISGSRFTVMNYGGSSFRWSYEYTFDYARRHRAWQLVRVEESSFHALDPERTKEFRTYATRLRPDQLRRLRSRQS